MPTYKAHTKNTPFKKLNTQSCAVNNKQNKNGV